jgi:hypothetical protein
VPGEFEVVTEPRHLDRQAGDLAGDFLGHDATTGTFREIPNSLHRNKTP